MSHALCSNYVNIGKGAGDQKVSDFVTVQFSSPASTHSPFNKCLFVLLLSTLPPPRKRKKSSDTDSVCSFLLRRHLCVQEPFATERGETETEREREREKGLLLSLSFHLFLWCRQRQFPSEAAGGREGRRHLRTPPLSNATKISCTVHVERNFFFVGGVGGREGEGRTSSPVGRTSNKICISVLGGEEEEVRSSYRVHLAAH